MGIKDILLLGIIGGGCLSLVKALIKNGYVSSNTMSESLVIVLVVIIYMQWKDRNKEEKE